MRLILLLLATISLSAVDHTGGIRVIKGIDASGASTLNVWLDQISGANWLVGNDGNTAAPARYLFGSGLSVSSADGDGNRTISVSAGGSAPSVASQTRTLNSSFQPSSTAAVAVRYAIKITTSLTLAGGSEGDVILEQADDSGFTTNVVTLDIGSASQTGTLVVGITLGQAITVSVGADYVPAAKYLRIRTSNVVGTPTYSFRSGREVTY